MYVGIGIGGVFYSYDSLTWYNSSTGTALINNASAPQIGKVIWNGNLWVAVGNGASYTIIYSYDGIIWTGVAGSKTLFEGTGGAMDIVWNGSLFVVVGASSFHIIATSSDGINWSFSSVKVSGTPNPPTNITTSSATLTSLLVSFTPPPQPVSFYYIVATPSVGTTVSQSFNAPTTSFTITSLASSTLYSAYIYSLNGFGGGQSSVLFNIATLTAAPTGLTLTNVSTSTLLFSFTPTTGTISSYTVTAVPSSGTTVSQTFSSPASSYTVTGLVSGTLYTVSLVATGTSGLVSSSSSTIQGTTITNAPTGLTGTSATNSSITFSFTPPTGSVTSYTVTAIPTTGSTVTQTFSAPSTSYTITGLPYTVSSVSYAISLTATNAGGTSVASSSINYSKLATSVPSVPTGLSGASGSTISWTASSDLSITGYTVQAIPTTTGTTITQNFSAPATTYTITGLTTGLTYNASLSATNIAGTSNYTTAVTVSTLNSILLTSGMIQSLGVSTNITLLYRASRDGFAGSVFHSKCDNQGATLSVIRATNGRIAGGFTPTSWNSLNQYISVTSGQAYLFSTSGNTATKYFNTIYPQYSMYTYVNYGPTFGGGHDLNIADNSNTNNNSYSYAHSYSGFSSTTLFGSQNFQTNEIEVFKIG